MLNNEKAVIITIDKEKYEIAKTDTLIY